MPFDWIDDDAAARINRAVLRSEADAIAESMAGHGGRVPSRRSTAEILIRNDTGSDLAAFQIVGLNEPLFLPVDDPVRCDGLPAFSGVTPVKPDHCGKWAALVAPALASSSAPDYRQSFARAVLVGHAVVRVYVNATTDEFCDVIDYKTVGGETVWLGTGDKGVRILWLDPSATAETIAWAIVNIGSSHSGSNVVIGRLTTNLMAGGAAEMWVFGHDPLENASRAIVYDWSLLPAGSVLPSGYKCTAVEVSGKYYIMNYYREVAPITDVAVNDVDIDVKETKTLAFQLEEEEDAQTIHTGVTCEGEE